MTDALAPLVHKASTLAAAGRWPEAEQAWREVQRLDPQHPQALFGLGFHAFHRNDLSAARQWLEAAVQYSPKDVLAHLTLASVCGAQADLDAEWQAIEAALVVDPYSLAALVMKAGCLERSGRLDEACRQYGYALQVAPVAARWPEALRAQLEHGSHLVHRRSSALSRHLDSRLAEARGALPESHRSQWREAADLLAGRSKPYHAQANQLQVPRLPAIPFYERSQFPWLGELEAATPVIREELQQLLGSQQEAFSPYIAYQPGQPVNQWAELNHSQRWSALHLWRGGVAVEENLARCPATAALLRRMQLAEIPGLCPNVMFSALAPHTRIPPHHGETNARLVAHLPLVIPPDCGLRVGYETRSWTLGEALIFDDCIEHEAFNHSDALRVVLIFDLWNPLLSPEERHLVQEMTRATREFGGLDASQ